VPEQVRQSGLPLSLRVGAAVDTGTAESTNQVASPCLVDQGGGGALAGDRTSKSCAPNGQSERS